MIAIDDGEGTTIFRETVLVAQLETMVISSIGHCVVDTVATTLAHVLTESSMVTAVASVLSSSSSSSCSFSSTTSSSTTAAASSLWLVTSALRRHL